MLKFFRLPFATTGDKTAVPDDVDTNGNVSYSQGYGFDYQRQKTDPAAKNIERDKMNQILFDVTNAVAELQSQGAPDFITTALNGGTAYSYEQFAIVRHAGDLYISLEAANTADPTDPTKWALLPTPARIQAAFNTSAVAGGTANALTGAFSPAIAALPAAPGTLSVLVRAGSANTTTTPTFSPDGLTAKTIVKGNNLPLVAGDIAGAGHWLDLQYDATLDKWILQNPATGVTGALQLASTAEAQAGTNNTKAISPATLKDAQIQLGSVINSTSGVAIDFTGIPSWAKRIVINFNGVSTNGGSPMQVQLGSGTFKTSGYSGSATGASSAVSSINASTGLLVENARAAVEATFGHMVLTHMGGNTWVSSSVRGQTGTAATSVAGCAGTLTGTLDRIRLTTVSGTDTFDAGNLSISWE